MQKPKDFDTAKAWGDYEALPAGGYVCEIIGVEETKSSTGKPMIKIALDIAEGEEKGRFMEAYKNDTRDDKKWPNGAVMYQLTEDANGNTHGKFKQFTDCVIDSNKGFEITWGDQFAACFKGKLIGVIFGREQYVNRDGELKWSTKPQFYKAASDIREGRFKVPEDKLFNGGAPSGFTPVKDEDIPF